MSVEEWDLPNRKSIIEEFLEIYPEDFCKYIFSEALLKNDEEEIYLDWMQKEFLGG